MPSPRLRLGLAAWLLSGSALVLAQSPGAAPAQQVGGAKPAPLPPPVFEPLGRYAPAGNLTFYAESLGLLGQEDAWKNTAAAKLLADAGVGEFLGSIAAQLAEQATGTNVGRKLNGQEMVDLLAYIHKHGGMVAGVDGARLVVLRNAARKDVRPVFARLMAALAPAGNPKLAAKSGGRSVVAVPSESDPKAVGSVWWAEQDDLVLVVGAPDAPGSADAAADRVIATLDGAEPNATTVEAVAELFKPGEDFQPNGVVYLDAAALPASPNGERLSDHVRAVDYRWGFQDDALLGVARLHTTSPRRGLLTLVDQPTFNRDTLPPIPEGTTDLAVLSTTPEKLLDQILAYVGPIFPAANTAVEDLEQDLKSDRVDLRKDILGRLGPRFALYATPSTARPVDAEAPAPGTPAPAPSPLMALLSPPKYTLVADVNDTKEFTKTLDEVIIHVNRKLRKYPVGPEPPPPPPGAEKKEDAKKKKEEPKNVMAFRTVLVGNTKSFVLQIPRGALTPAQAASIRPVVRMGAKNLVISTAGDTGRQAAELKPEDQIQLDGELATPLSRLPGNLIFLGVADPRSSVPLILPTLPFILNTHLALGGASLANIPGPIGAAFGQRAAAPATAPPGQPGAPPAGASVPGATPAPNAPGAAASAWRVQVDPDKVPVAATIRQYLFPMTLAVSADAQTVTITTRESTPSLISPQNLVALSVLSPALARTIKGGASDAPAQPAAPTPGAPGMAAPGAPGMPIPGGAGRPPVGASGPPGSSGRSN